MEMELEPWEKGPLKRKISDLFEGGSIPAEKLKDFVSGDGAPPAECLDRTNIIGVPYSSLLELADEAIEELDDPHISTNIKNNGLADFIHGMADIQFDRHIIEKANHVLFSLVPEVEELQEDYPHIEISDISSSILDHIPPFKVVGDVEFYKNERENIDSALKRVKVHGVSFLIRGDK